MAKYPRWSCIWTARKNRRTLVETEECSDNPSSTQKPWYVVNYKVIKPRQNSFYVASRFMPLLHSSVCTSHQIMQTLLFFVRSKPVSQNLHSSHCLKYRRPDMNARLTSLADQMINEQKGKSYQQTFANTFLRSTLILSTGAWIPELQIILQAIGNLINLLTSRHNPSNCTANIVQATPMYSTLCQAKKKYSTFVVHYYWSKLALYSCGYFEL